MEWPAIITAVTGLVGCFLTYLLTRRKNDTDAEKDLKKTNVEVADKEADVDAKRDQLGFKREEFFYKQINDLVSKLKEQVAGMQEEVISLREACQELQEKNTAHQVNEAKLTLRFQQCEENTTRLQARIVALEKERS